MNGALAGLVILVLGDSHMAGPTYLISSLHEALEAQGATVDSYGMCGANPDAWLEKTTVSCGRAERHGAAADPGGKRKAGIYLANQRFAQQAPPQHGDRRGGRRDGRLRLAATTEGVDLRSVARAGDAHQCGGCFLRLGGAGLRRVNSPYHKADDRVRELSEFLSQSVAPCVYVDLLKFES